MPEAAACEWCGRAVVQDGNGRWIAVKGAERGYDPLFCAASEDGQQHASPSSWAPFYDRAVLVNVLVYHYRADITGCGCGWADLGRSWPEHVATIYEESVSARA